MRRLILLVVIISCQFEISAQQTLLPAPQTIIYKKGNFLLSQCRTISFTHDSLKAEAEWLKNKLSETGIKLFLEVGTSESQRAIVLQLGSVPSPKPNEEAYTLNITPENITLTGSSPHAVFNGIQTLIQLISKTNTIATCVITDWPAFAWRGYLIDVGRNYVPLNLLKEQIDVMARYKLNVFHFHPTEDIAWRLQSRQFPELTAAENMLRDKGEFYSVDEIKELIAYCKARHILFLPEIDMPGHSAAFRRAMKTDMQSDSGLAIVKNILRDFFETYDLPYIHIGADEVKITNQQFIPEVTRYIESFGRKIIGWQPGGNFSEGTLRQLWMDDLGSVTGNEHIQYVDSRHLYLNHMDPLESVVTIFNRQICNQTSGTRQALGGTICLWNDRIVARPEDLLRMNPVYPSMLAFAERSWRGGGKAGWIANIGDGDIKGFQEFETRLLAHKQRYFKNKPFPYAKQSDLKWQLIGPYSNHGDLKKQFEPEISSSDFRLLKADSLNLQLLRTVIPGGTIILRHWWAPLIRGAIEHPVDSSTWYATTRIWSDKDGEKQFWIGFNNFSRSPATDSPPAEQWNNEGDAVWVNGKPIPAPLWKRGGMKGNSETPLVDEGYEFRAPAKITMQKGWNTVLIKAPIGSLKGKDWQNPVKWMFTFVEVK